MRVPKRQWDLPAGVDVRSGKTADLRQVLDPRVETVAFHELSRRRQIEIAVLRIRKQKGFRLLQFGSKSVITKRSAIEALHARTPLGEALLQIERRLLASLYEEITHRRGRRAKGGRP